MLFTNDISVALKIGVLWLSNEDRIFKTKTTPFISEINTPCINNQQACEYILALKCIIGE